MATDELREPLPRTLVVVDWIDSHSAKDGWKPLGEIADSAEPLHCRSAGWIIAETKDMLVLVSSISGEKNGNIRLFGRGEIAIPKRAIVRRRKA